MTLQFGSANRFEAAWHDLTPEAQAQIRERFESRLIKHENGCWHFAGATLIEPQFSIVREGGHYITKACAAALLILRGVPVSKKRLLRCSVGKGWCVNPEHITIKESRPIGAVNGHGGARYAFLPEPTPEQHAELGQINFLKYADAAEIYGVSRERVRQICTEAPVKLLSAEDRAEIANALRTPAPTAQDLANRLHVKLSTARHWLRIYGEQIREQQFAALQAAAAARRQAVRDA